MMLLMSVVEMPGSSVGGSPMVATLITEAGELWARAPKATREEAAAPNARLDSSLTT